MPESLCRAENEDGTLKFRMGSPAIHIFDRAFVEKLNKGGHIQLPFHRAVKKVPYVNECGEQVNPEEPNAVKLEMFVFDALPLASNVMILEASREEQFGPVKNATGVDSAESSRELYQERCARWLALAGISVPRAEDGSLNCKLELSPRSFLDVDDVMAKADELKSPMPKQEEYYE
jgi:UDP-N-acetylglucosamine/UDP-N-acetylgalactosamine diphosphorylase